MDINIVIYFSILFFILELVLLISKKSIKKISKVRNDKKSLLLFWIIIPISISTGFVMANYETWSYWNSIVAIIGLTIFATGLAIRWMSIIQLGKEFTVDVSVTNEHNLKKNGLYSYVRHPSYLGLLFVIIGISIAMNSLVSFIVIFFPILLVIIYRINIEERTLVKEFGDAYINYSLNTKKLVPLIF
jgi:protein-S-isoprenylcysteine O-methyltransferase Ste14